MGLESRVWVRGFIRVWPLSGIWLRAEREGLLLPTFLVGPAGWSEGNMLRARIER